MKDSPSTQDQNWIDAGAVCVMPYYGPWSWMNNETVDFVDELVECVRREYGLISANPLIATGGSMGGYAALEYAIASKLSVTACFANCPVCDLAALYTERPDVPRTLHHAFGSYCDISAALKAHSPLQQVDQLPNIPYLIVHGAEDSSVTKATHSDRLAAAMRNRGLALEYVQVAGMGHCGPLSDEIVAQIECFVASGLI
ncbi:MAG: prolyl oligopeptidase family serine peptidase [Capsulimonadaceae bacterium]|nr:prolyl oligopeptidase family serine peptidase [Capsulimonadaceae bacterium]